MSSNRNRLFVLYMVGGCFLAGCAAAVNVHCIRLTGYSVSHLTGDIARIPLAKAHSVDGTVPLLGVLALVTVSFMLGAGLAGAFIHHPRFAVRRPYGRALLAVASLLALACLVEQSHMLAALPIAAVACGLQNAMSTHYRGLVLRTTHITGICTDFGQYLGMRLSGHAVESWKLIAHATILVGFMLGGLIGYHLDLLIGHYFLLAMAGIYGVAGLTWLGLRRRLIRTFAGDVYYDET